MFKVFRGFSLRWAGGIRTLDQGVKVLCLNRLATAHYDDYSTIPSKCFQIQKKSGLPSGRDGQSGIIPARDLPRVALKSVGLSEKLFIFFRFIIKSCHKHETALN